MELIQELLEMANVKQKTNKQLELERKEKARKESEKDFGKFDIKDDMVGTAKVCKDKVTEETYTDFKDWQDAVRNSYPKQAKQIKFKGRFEGGKNTISAEIPGEDRSYGVWDAHNDIGYILHD